MLNEVHIYDMDGTLVDSSHRYRIGENGKIDLAHWIEHCKPEFIAKDKLLPLAEQYKKQLDNPGVYVVIATARVLESADMQYIREVLGMPNKIISRNGRSDNRKGAKMKIDGLRFLRTLKQFARLPKYFYEDNKDYLYPVAEYLGAKPVYIPSCQGV
jgi:hydroxymethylpyrimidine pyrophosphatase-like HAD family hydrolase